MAGRRIDDHASFAGKSGKYPLPEGNKMKSFSSEEGAGAVMDYPDTSEDIKRDQGMNVSKMHAHKIKAGHRN